MKHTIFKIILFISTFFFGCLIAFQISKSIEILEMIPVPAPPILESTVTQPRRTEDFIPEIKDLPNLNETRNEPRTSVSLVDVLESEGSYRKSEVIAKTGQMWLGLFNHDGRFSLEATKVSVQAASSDRGYWDDGSVILKFSKQTLPTFIIRNAKTLKLGKVVSLYYRISPVDINEGDTRGRKMAIGFSAAFDLNNKIYKLRVAPGMARDGTKLNVLILETGSQSQIITYNAHYAESDNIGDLFWVGDLDNDGKLDLYFSDYDSQETGSFQSHLFLSSQAKQGKLVKRVATFKIAGC